MPGWVAVPLRLKTERLAMSYRLFLTSALATSESEQN
jgi:hypothetical protein